MAMTIAVANMKGGVGKTASVISLAETLAANSVERAAKGQDKRKSILVVDLDAQASASFALAGDEKLLTLIKQGRTLDGFLDRFLVRREEVDFGSFVTRQISDVSHRNAPLDIGLLASSPRLRIVERNLLLSLTRGGYSLDKVEHDFYQLLSGRIRALSVGFDYVIFDCPPGISVLTEIALRLADITIVPTIPDFLSLLGLDAFTQNIWSRLSKGPNGLPPPRSVPYVLINRRRPIAMHDKKVSELRRRVAEGRADYRVFITEIPDAEGVPEALERVTTFPNYVQKWNAELRSHLVDLASEVDSLLAVPP
jgi:cellulose biosynthesis protein BcsQ